MEAAALLGVATRREVAAVCVLAVSDVPGPPTSRDASNPQAARAGGAAAGPRSVTRRSGSGDRQPSLTVRRSCARGTGCSSGGDRVAQGREVAGDLVEPLPRWPPSGRLRELAALRRAPRSSSLSIASSMLSSRCERERRRRVTRSMSAADGMFSAPIAASWGWTAFLRASNARVKAEFTIGFPISSSAIRPRASSPPRDKPVNDALVVLGGGHRRQGSRSSRSASRTTPGKPLSRATSHPRLKG